MTVIHRWLSLNFNLANAPIAVDAKILDTSGADFVKR
jgi:hypothetical protein